MKLKEQTNLKKQDQLLRQVDVDVSWDLPKEITEIEAAFPAKIIGKFLPKWNDIPEEFRKNWTRNKWCDKASELFYKGGKLPKIKNGVDNKLAGMNIWAILGSFEPKHEHKIAGAGYLMSLWCEDDS